MAVGQRVALFIIVSLVGEVSGLGGGNSSLECWGEKRCGSIQQGVLICAADLHPAPVIWGKRLKLGVVSLFQLEQPEISPDVSR